MIEHVLIWMLHRASLQMKTRKALPKKSERTLRRIEARRFRAQVDAWWIGQLRFEKCGMKNLDNLRPAQIRAEILEQLSSGEWLPEGHVFSAVLNTPGVVPTQGLTKLRAALRYLQRRGKVISHYKNEMVYWRLTP